MIDDYIAISTLNDFIFCPYSIYLHNVYMDTDEGLYHAIPQTRGKIAHQSIDWKDLNMLDNTIVVLCKVKIYCIILNLKFDVSR
jgi:CRISPR-associated protein Cas4